MMSNTEISMSAMVTRYAGPANSSVIIADSNRHQE